MKILVVGGGIGGMSAVIQLMTDGHDVELIDIDPGWRVYGAGITITGPTLRAYRRLGLLDQLRSRGAISKGSRILKVDGSFIANLDEPALEEGLPATGGIMRPVLHALMQERIAELGGNVRLGLTIDALDQTGDGVAVRLSDGSEGQYDVVIGSDGVSSIVRRLAFPDRIEPVNTGQGCWRVSMRTPHPMDRGEFYIGGIGTAGITPCAPDALYLWLLTPHAPGFWVEEARAHDQFRALLADYGGTAGWVRDNMLDTDWINYRPLSAALQPGPWANGRIVLLGDSAHATTPHLASGAGMAVEGALVLAEELREPGRSVEAALLAYSERRYPRCRLVVESSVESGRLQLEGAPPQIISAHIGRALHALAEEY